MKKKLLALLLACSMVMSVAPAAFAEGSTQVAQIGADTYDTLDAAIDAAGDGAVVIDLLADATLDYNAREAYGIATTTSLTINGNGNTLTLNQKDGDWSSIGLANADAKLVLNNMTIEKTGYGDTSGAWNTHAIIIKSDLEMTNVTVNNSVAVEADAKLTDVTINEANDYYSLWISANGQTVEIDGLTVNSAGRGIKIDEQYVDNVAEVTLSVKNATFTTAAKAAIMVKSAAGATITTEAVDITNVAADSTNPVWVDEDGAAAFGNVTVEGGTVVQEGEDSFVASVGSDNAISGYYKTLQAAINAATEGETVTLLASYEDFRAIQVVKTITIDLNGFNINRTFGGLAVDVTDGSVTITGNGKISGSANGVQVAYDAELKLEEGVTVEARDGHGVDNDGKLTVDGATITATEYGIVLSSDLEGKWAASLEMLDGSVSGEYGIAAYANTTVTVKGGTVTGTVAGLAGHGNEHGTTFTVEGGTIQSEGGVGIYHPQNGALTISGGTIKGATGINIKSGTMNVTGGDIIGTGEDADYSFVGGGFNITGDALAVESCGYPGGAPAVSITGGNFTSENADAVASYAGNGVTETVTGFISGGYFSNDPKDYVAAGMDSYDLKNGMWTVEASDATVTVTFKSEGKTVETQEVPYAGNAASVRVTREGYDFEGWYLDGEEFDFDTIIVEDITLTAKWDREPVTPVGPTAYKVDIEADGVESSHKTAKKGEAVTLTVEEGLEIIVLDEDGDEIELTYENGEYTFEMPGCDVTVEEVEKVVGNPFLDVADDAYYTEAVLWAVKNGITTGTGAVTFSPDASCTRAQVVTFLWRAAGSPEPKSTEMPFADVAADAYYYNAVLWAVEVGITDGTSATTFSPDAACTRAQIVTFLWRSQGSEDASAYNPFVDVANDAYYTEAVLWAVENGITNGTGADTFSPDADCTRGQIVTFLYRCLAK